MRLLQGGCHCGAVRYRLRWPDDSGAVPARQCGCSYCTSFDGTWTSHPRARLDIEYADPASVGRYRFGTATADFEFCGNCGVTLFAIGEFEQGEKAVINVHTLDPGQGIEFSHSRSNFDGETLDQRLERRDERWIGTVTRPR